ncbi:hypothetical protein BBO99_00001365 [Phytophthora kernoviae]|uniref:PPM-type phosphatase domain-containing protein n=2 Tax=Phytophthora kernoviae TaxID=325452 RepID=A0A3F2RMD6_9STRA|nr:hypothetical protein G195_002352 [Phytophthora kernoviae 00238/432]KAG2522847.1 hypothetical protein JM16_005606 [Phytophthora kernoviae]KAG2530781.1 hypothetical protein JM18_001198 [Phytophthora kernoviae]RLN10285.1 hypothetical protein BBI17_001145 [Phytophthora kernoviae]RLN60434.1 hypothetical protein BBP00_00005988 [Phytophthora kernoviae]
MATRSIQKMGSTAKIRLTEATATNVASPKGISIKTPGKLPAAQAGGDHSLATIDDVDSSANVLANENSAIMAFAGLSKKGYAPYNPRKKNQDSMVIKYDQNTQSLLLCVFDGHGEAGDGVSGAIRDQFATELFAHAKFARTGDIQSDIETLRTAITDTLQSVEQTVLRDPSIDTEFSGTTAVVSVIRDNLVVVGNVGDSRITRGFVKQLSPSGPDAVDCKELSIDHKPDRPDEKARIVASGGRVFAVEYDDGIDGPPRVWLGHMDVPGLAMSRSLGDAVAHTAGVLSEPEFTSHWLDANDRCLIVATDGLWEFMSNEECMEIAMGQQDPKVAVDLLIMEANRRWMKEEQVIDDTTIIVAYVDTAGLKSPDKVTV